MYIYPICIDKYIFLHVSLNSKANSALINFLSYIYACLYTYIFICICVYIYLHMYMNVYICAACILYMAAGRKMVLQCFAKA